MHQPHKTQNEQEEPPSSYRRERHATGVDGKLPRELLGRAPLRPDVRVNNDRQILADCHRHFIATAALAVVLRLEAKVLAIGREAYSQARFARWIELCAKLLLRCDRSKACLLTAARN